MFLDILCHTKVNSIGCVMTKKGSDKPYVGRNGGIFKQDAPSQSQKICDEEAGGIAYFDTRGEMPPGKVVTESTKGDVRKRIKK